MVSVVRPGQVTELTVDEGRAFVEARVREVLHIGLADFIQQWQSGEFGDLDVNPKVLELVMLLPIVGIDPWSNGSRT